MTLLGDIISTVGLRIFAALLALAALVVVVTAWLFELAGYLPCQLCLWQRIPYYIIIPILLTGALLSANLARVALAFAAMVFASGAVLAAYHTGVEWGFWPGPTSCGVGNDFNLNSTDNLLSALQKVTPPSCNEAAGRFLGLSFAGWNVIASVVFVFLSLSAFRVVRSQS